MSPKEEDPDPPPKSRLHWRRRLLFCFLLLIGFLAWCDGPGIRWGLKKVLLQQLAAQELSGTFVVEGNALSGISIRDISLDGKSTIQRVESDVVQVKWSLESLIDKELESILLNKLHVVIDPEAPKPKASREDPTPEQDSDTKTPLINILDLFRGFIQPAEITITDLDIEVVDVTKVSLASFTHTADETDYLISNLKSLDHLKRPIHNNQSTLTWTETGFAIDKITLNPLLTIRNISFKPEKSASLIISIAESQLLVESDLALAHQVTLKSPSLSIPDVIKLAKPDLEAAGKITKLEINTANGLINFEARGLKFEGQKISQITINASTENLLSPFKQSIKLEAAIDERLKAKGFVKLNQTLLDSSAKLSVIANWPEIPTVNAEIAYDSREARVIANTLDDLRATARFQVDQQTYQAEILSKIKDAVVVEDRLAGPLEFTSKGRGNLKTGEHSGTLNLISLGFRKPDFPEAVTQGKISWNWPESVTVETLKMTTPTGSAQARLGWQNDTLTIHQIELVDKNEQLLSITGNIPTPPTIRSVEDFLSSNQAVSLQIKSEPLTLKRLSSFAPIPEEISGIAQANVELTGSFAAPSLNGIITLDDFKTTYGRGLRPADLSVTFKTKNQQLTIAADAGDTDGELLKLRGEFPFLPRAWADQMSVPGDSPILLQVSNQGLDLRRIQKFIPTVEGMTGDMKLDLSLSGTIDEPSLEGDLKVSNFRTSLQPKLPGFDLTLDFKTVRERLKISAKVMDGGRKALTLAGTIPALPEAWRKDARNGIDQALDITATIPNFNLKRVQPLVPVIKSIDGDVRVDAVVSGTINDPSVSANARMELARMRLTEFPITDFQDCVFEVEMKDKIVSVKESSIVASGGKAKIRGSIDLTGDEPFFDVGLTGRFILLYRTADFTFRGHPDLKVRGPLSKAKISGNIAITESLVYKDVEILPFGVPRTTEIPIPNLPSFAQKPSPAQVEETLSGVMDWKLDIKVETTDAVLIRGNLIKGKIESENLRITGTLGDPKASGSLSASELEADLPFSILEVQTGVVTLRQNALTNPFIDLRGTSKVGQYSIQIYLSGAVQDPKLVLTSDPPLPESEIMLLLATGSVSAQLSNQQVASQKALQFLFEGLRRRNREKDDNVFQRLLKNSEQIDLSLGETNRYSGRNFSSATIQLGKDWDFTTQIDDQGQTRALVIFSVRFR